MRFLAAVLMMALAFAPAFARAQQVPQSSAQISLSFAPVVKQVAPAVVNIYANRVVKVRENISPFMNDPLFRQLFEGSPMAQGMVREKVERSLGSGVIIAADGLVVTSNHVIQNAQDIKITLSDRREFSAQVVKRDQQTDLAFLKITANEQFPFLQMRDSDALEVGELVLAVGNPFGIGQTVTQGIISALARAARGVSDYEFFIQTDAAINPGNSGGALVDTAGRLIGINTAIYSTSGGSNGIGFAIPANMVKAVQSSEVSEGKLVRSWLGVSVQPVTAEVAQSIGLKTPRGVLVKQVIKDGPAEKAGIKSGDVILSVAGNEVTDERSLQYRIGTHPVGGKVEVVLLRKGKEQTVSATLGKAPPVKIEAKQLKGRHPLAGLTVGTLNEALVQDAGLNPAVLEQGGVIILGGNNAGGGITLRPGDIILEVNGKPVKDIDQLEALLKIKTRSWNVVLRRQNSIITLAITG